MPDPTAEYADMMRSENPVQWLIQKYGHRAKDLIAWNLSRGDPVYDMTVTSAVMHPDPKLAAAIFSRITGYQPSDRPGMRDAGPPPVSQADAPGPGGDIFSTVYSALSSDLLRLRAYDLWDDLSPAERAEAIGYIRQNILELRERQKTAGRPENDELIGLLAADLADIAKRDAAKPPKSAPPRNGEIDGVLASMNALQLKGIMKMYAIPGQPGIDERQAIRHFLATARSPIMRYAVRKHFGRIVAIRKKTGPPPGS